MAIVEDITGITAPDPARDSHIRTLVETTRVLDALRARRGRPGRDRRARRRVHPRRPRGRRADGRGRGAAPGRPAPRRPGSVRPHRPPAPPAAAAAGRDRRARPDGRRRPGRGPRARTRPHEHSTRRPGAAWTRWARRPPSPARSACAARCWACCSSRTTSSARPLTAADRDLLCEIASRAGQALASERHVRHPARRREPLRGRLRVRPDRHGADVGRRGRGPIATPTSTPPCARSWAAARTSSSAAPSPTSCTRTSPAAPRSPASAGSCGPTARSGSAACSPPRWTTAAASSCQILDVTEQRRNQHELAHLATHDRAHRRCSTARASSRSSTRRSRPRRRHGQTGAVAIFDLDNFKVLNDTYGVAAGDALLRLVAARCASRLRATDAVGRIGDDEFGVVLAATADRAAAESPPTWSTACAASRCPPADQVVRPTVSAGLRTLRTATACGRRRS